MMSLFAPGLGVIEPLIVTFWPCLIVDTLRLHEIVVSVFPATVSETVPVRVIPGSGAEAVIVRVLVSSDAVELA